MQPSSVKNIPSDRLAGEPLAPWTYACPELHGLEYEKLFLSRWQFAGHCTEIVNAGDYLTQDIGRDSILVMRDKVGELRAFLNVCRHRASRLLAGPGNCGNNIQCPYHGWTYGLDGSLKGVPQQKNFPLFDRANYGLYKVELEVFNGLIFIRVKGNGESVAQQFSHTAHYFEKYDVRNYVQIAEPKEEIWPVNWKVVWDNYLENYHIPTGHPGLNRLARESDEFEELTSGISYGVFAMNEKHSEVDEERQYQEKLHHADHRVPDELKGRWVQFGFSPNLGIDLYPEMLDTFQIIPLEVHTTMVRASFYGHQNPTAEEIELRRLNRLINGPINEEDRRLCLGVEKGLQSYGYQPGPLSSQESCIFNFHELIRSQIPVTRFKDKPALGTITAENAKLLDR